MTHKIENQVQIVKQLLQIGAFLQKTGNRLTREAGLTQQQFVVLNEIVTRGSVNQKQLVGELLLEKSNVSKIVKKLHCADLIEITASSDDARSTVLAPTKKGTERCNECMHRLNAWNVKWLQAFSEDQLETSVSVLERLKHLISTAS